MIGEILLARLHVDPPGLSQFAHSVREIENVARVKVGFEGMSLWSDPQNPQSFVVAFEAQSENAMDEILQAVIASPAYESLQKPIDRASSNRWIRVIKRSGRSLSAATPGNFLSASIRTAEPGRGAELAADYDMVFEGLAMLPGYLGSAYGSVNRVPEMLIGLVLWQDEAAFRGSIRPGKKLDLRLLVNTKSTD